MRGVASGAINGVCAKRHRLTAVTLILLCLSGGCAGWWSRKLPPPDPALKIVVAQITLEAPITKSTQMQTFEETPSPEIEPVMRTQLIEEVELRAQRLLTELLAAQQGFQVMPFGETRRLFGNLGGDGSVTRNSVPLPTRAGPISLSQDAFPIMVPCAGSTGWEVGP
jgi:hypothetical protein